MKDEQELTKQQADLLKVQSRQLELQRQQLDDQQQANARQVSVLELQASELREIPRAARTRSRRPAPRASSQVFLTEETRGPLMDGSGKWVTSPKVTATVVNASDRPIYDGELRWHRGSAPYGEPNPKPLGTIMPGTENHRGRDFPLDANMAVSGATLAFRDAAGVRWLRSPDGGLVEQQ